MVMETLRGKKIELQYLQNSLIKIIDVVNFDGPLLTLFENYKNNHFFLFDWSDSDEQFNRWLVYRCNPSILKKFINEDISQYDLIFSDESTCYSIDIDGELNWYNGLLLSKKDIPEVYLPQKDIFFEEADCPNFEKLKEFVNSKADRLRASA